MKILILGGTHFLGRHLVNSARVRGHDVTLFNRGQTNPDPFQKVKKIRGDREKDTLGWVSELPADYEMKAGLKPEREKELLELLKNVQ